MAANSLVSINGAIGMPSNRQMLAAAGKYFVATNPTPGTAIAYSLKTAFSATANGFFSVSNGNPTGGANIQLDRLKIIQTATAATGNLCSRFEIYNEGAIMAITTAALAVVPVNVNSAFPNTTGATVTFFSSGAGTVPTAAGVRRLVGIGSLNTGPSILYDSLTIEFGADASTIGTTQLTATKATAAADYVTWGPPVTIAPGTSAYMNFWIITQAANTPSYEFMLGYSEL